MKHERRLRTISAEGLDVKAAEYLIPLTKQQVRDYIRELRLKNQYDYVLRLVGKSPKKFEQMLRTVEGADIIEYIIDCDNKLPLTETQIVEYVDELKKKCDFKALLKYMETNENSFFEMLSTVKGYNYAVRLINNFNLLR